MISSWVLAILICLCTFSATSAAEQVEDAPLTETEVLSEVPVVGHRPVPQNALIFDNKKNTWEMDLPTVYLAAANDPEFIRSSGTSPAQVGKLSPAQVVSAYRTICRPPNVSSDAFNDCLLRLSRDKNIVKSSNPDDRIDTTFVRVALSKWASDQSDEPRVLIKGDFAAYTHDQYKSLDEALAGPNQPLVSAFKHGLVIRNAGQNPQVALATAVTFTKVKIGTPIIFTAREKNLKIEPSLTRSKDFYWLQLAINPTEDLRETVQDISFFTKMKTKGAQAHELAPLRFGQEHLVREERSIPEIKVEGKAIGFSLGKIFGEEVSYKVLKPTIVGTGLQASEFGWSLSDEMIDMSAKRLIAIISVPKGAKKIELEMVIVVKLKGYIYYFKDNVASSQPIAFIGNLPE